MKFFVTGATGFVGSWVAEKLVEKKAEVICLVRSTSNLKWLNHLPVKFHHGSLFDIDSLKAGIKGVDYILHIGGVTKALKTEDYYRGNVEATRNILQAATEVNPDIKKIVHVSSQAAVGPSPSKEAIDESFPCNPLTDYGESKLESENVAKEYMRNLPITILRPPAVYGPKDTDVFEVFRNVKYRINLKIGNIEQFVSMIHVFDLAAGIIHSAEHADGASKTYFICNDEPYSWSEVIASLKKIMKKNVLNIAIPYPVAYGVASVVEALSNLRNKPTILSRQKIKEIQKPYWVISNKKIKTELSYSSKVSLEEGLKICYDWYKKNNWL